MTTATATADRSRSPYRKYLFTYLYGGTEWSIEIPALSADEAKERMKVLPFAQCHGETAGMQPVTQARRPRQTWVASWFKQAG